MTIDREKVTFDSDRPLAVNGVPGRLTHRTVKPGSAPGLWTRQRWISEARPVSGYDKGATLRAEIRFDDECGNGHNRFAITAEVRVPRRRDIEAGGCLHDDIAAVFPELAPLIRWHLVSTDSPMHYVANTVYHAGDRDHYGRRAGEPCAWEYGVRFDGVPVTHRLKKSFYEFLSERMGSGDFAPVAIAHKENGKPGAYQFAPKYTPAGYTDEWHKCPWHDKTQADEFCEALNTCAVEFVEIPTAWSEGKARDFDAARSCGVWPDATDEELSADPETLKAALLERLPALQAEFRADVERAGFLWSPEDYKSE